MDGGIIVPVAFFAFLAAIIVAPQYFRARARERLLDTMKYAYERGQPVPPDVLDALQNDQRVPRERRDNDLRRAIVLIAVALGLLALGWSLQYTPGAWDGVGPTMAVAAFPGFIGLGYLALWYFSSSRRSN